MTCTCEHDRHRAPATQDEALALADLQNRIAKQLELLRADGSKWMSVLRCKACGAIWCEDTISSGHATLSFIYPITTNDPVAWLAAAKNLF